MVLPCRLLACLCAAIVCLMALSSCGNPFEEETYHPPFGEGPWILVDLYHSRKQNPEDYRLSKGDYDYQGAFGYHRAFAHLESNGYKWTSIRTMTLSDERLEGFDVLFVNLVDDHRPDFSVEERDNIRRFVEEGGGLFVVGDHTNVYGHAERINRLLEPMGIEVTYHTAADHPPQFSVAGLAWVMVFDFADHFVTDGVEMFSMQTGGVLQTDHGVAFTSQDSFGDLWDPSEPTGHYGNWTFDGDRLDEPLGPLPVVAARTYGDGRVVVVGDQNAFGDAWLHFGHNFELMMNAVQWLAGRDHAPPLRRTRPAGLNIGLDLIHDEFAVGRKGGRGYYNFFVNLNRDHQVTASGRMGIVDDDEVLVLLEPDIAFDTAAIEQIRQFLADRKTVIVSFRADRIPAATVGLLRRLAPHFSLSAEGAQYPFQTTAEADLGALHIPRIEGQFGLVSEQVNVNGLRVSDLAGIEENGQQRLSPYLLAVSSEWGNPFVTAQQGGHTVDIARRKSVAGGELIVFVQDGFWRNRVLGDGETTPPTKWSDDAVEFEYRLLDYLKQRTRFEATRSSTH